VLVGATNIDPVQRKGMGIKDAHLVVSTLISSFQCGLIEHDQNVPYSPVRVQNMVYGNFAKGKVEA